MGRPDVARSLPVCRAPSPVVEVAAAVGLAPVTNLRMGAAERVGNGAVLDFLGGSPEEFPDRYAVAEPNLTGVARYAVIEGDADDIVAGTVRQARPAGRRERSC